MFKKEISIDHDEESLEKEKQKQKENLGSVKHSLKDRKRLNNSVRKNNNTMSLNKNKNNHKIIFENKNIIINDITKNYGSNTNKLHQEKKKISIINKLSNDINSISNTNYKYEPVQTEINNKNNNHGTLRGKRKFYLEKKNDIKNIISNINKSGLKQRLSKPLLKSSFNEKIIHNMEKKKTSKNNDKLNKKKKFSFGDSYEFNFTFNNYNSNFTYNNTEDILKEDRRKTNKIVIDNLSKENIINKFKSIKPSSVRNNILGGLKNILNKNKIIDRKLTNPKFKEKNDKLEKINKNLYATKIQKIFRGYNFRKNNRLYFQNQNITSNFGIYIRKKILSRRSGLNSNLNNTDNNLIRNIYFKERNQISYNDSKKEYETENKIQEIIIDKNKILNVLNPSTKKNNIKEIHINNNYSFRNNIGKNKKYKLLKYFNHWKIITIKKLIIQKLIEFFGNKRNKIFNNSNIKLNFQNNNNNRFRYYKRTIFRNNNVV